MPEDARPRKRGRTAEPQPEPQPEPEQNGQQSQPTKTRRGRPVASQTQAQQIPGVDGEGEGTTQAKRRGRPTNRGMRNNQEPQEPTADEADDEDENEEGNPSLLRRSGRERMPMGEWYNSPNKAQPEGALMNAEGSREESSPKTTKRYKQQANGDKRRGKRAVNGTVADETEQEAEQQPLKRRSGRTAASSHITSEAEAEADGEGEEEPVSRGRKKRGRSQPKSPPTVNGRQSTAQQKQKRARSSLQQVQNADDQEDEEQQVPDRSSKRKGRLPRQSSDNVVEASSSQRAVKSRRGRAVRDREEDTTQEHRPEASKPGPDVQRKRKRPPTPSASPESEAAPEPEPPTYQHLASRTRRVPWGVIESKWEPLDAASIGSVTDLLASASRPVLLRLNNPARRAQAAAALGAISNRLRSKLSKGLPFPPPAASGTSGKDKGAKGRRPRPRDDELEYDRTVAGIRGLEATLDPLLHSVELLRRERDRAQRELEREYRVLATLKANARAQARERRTRSRRLHVLAAAGQDGSDDGDNEDSDSDGDDDAPLGLLRDADSAAQQQQRGTGNLFAEILDLDLDLGPDLDREEGGGSTKEELTALAAQIAGHMETMRGNLAQIDSVVPALAGGRAALAHVLAGHLAADRLQDVLLGSDGD